MANVSSITKMNRFVEYLNSTVKCELLTIHSLITCIWEQNPDLKIILEMECCWNDSYESYYKISAVFLFLFLWRAEVGGDWEQPRAKDCSLFGK